MTVQQVDEKIKEVGILKSFIEHIPVAIWAKRKDDYVMIYLNKMYEDAFLKPNGITKEDYINKTDFDVHPHNIAANYRENDMETIEPIQFEEKVQIAGITYQYRFIKFPFIFDGEEMIGGLAIDIH